jgi:hypothetical protein
VGIVLWERHLNRALDEIRANRPARPKIRIFGTPAKAQERVLAVRDALEPEGYEFHSVNRVAASPFFTVTDAYFTSSSASRGPAQSL